VEEKEERRHDAVVSGYESHERLSHCKHACNRDSSQLTWLQLGPCRHRCRRRCQFRIQSQRAYRSCGRCPALACLLPFAPPTLSVLEHRPAFATTVGRSSPFAAPLRNVRARSHVVIASALVTHGSATAVICVH